MCRFISIVLCALALACDGELACVAGYYCPDDWALILIVEDGEILAANCDSPEGEELEAESCEEE